MFAILDLDTRAFVTEGEDQVTFPTGKEAADYCKKTTGRRLAPRRTGDDANWRIREKARTVDGTYHRPPFLQLIEAAPQHYLHMSRNDPDRLAYTKDDAKGRADLQTLTSFKGYVERYCKDFDPYDISTAAKAFNRESIVLKGFKIAMTPDEIERVYTHYVSDSNASGYVAASCMRHSIHEYYGANEHPVRVYGSGDLGVAYLADEGKTIARALIWPYKKVYSRVYGVGDSLHRLLKAQGYRKSEGYYCPEDGSVAGANFYGAKLRRIEHGDDCSIFLMPYIDEDVGIKDRGGHLEIVKPGYGGDICHQNTHGWSGSVDSSPVCERCEDRTGDDGHNVFVNRHDTEIWCENCCDNHGFYCDYAGEWYCDEIASVEVDGGTWAEYSAKRYAVVLDRPSGDWTHRDNAVTVMVDGGTEKWSRGYADDYAEICDHTGLWSDHAVTVTVNTDGRIERWAPRFIEEDGVANTLTAAFRSDYDDQPYHYDLMVRLADGQRVSATHADLARMDCRALVSAADLARWEARRIALRCTLTGNDPGQLKLPLAENPYRKCGEVGCSICDAE